MDEDDTVPPIPKRPLTSYNIFSILERNYILQQNQKNDSVQTDNGDPYFAERPQRCILFDSIVWCSILYVGLMRVHVLPYPLLLYSIGIGMSNYPPIGLRLERTEPKGENTKITV